MDQGVAGALGAVIGTFGGHALRKTLARAFGRDMPAAFIEDALAILVGGRIVASGQPHELQQALGPEPTVELYLGGEALPRLFPQTLRAIARFERLAQAQMPRSRACGLLAAALGGAQSG